MKLQIPLLVLVSFLFPVRLPAAERVEEVTGNYDGALLVASEGGKLS